MKKSFLVLALMFSTCVWAADTVVIGYLVDVDCSSRLASRPEALPAHNKGCLLSCTDSGFGVVTPDKKFIRFDKAGNDKARQFLKETTQASDLRISVAGAIDGDTMTVSKIELSK